MRHLLPREPLADGHPGAFEQPLPQPERRHLRPVGAADWHRLFKLRLPDTPAVSTVDPTHLALPTGATCINPYYYNLAANSSQCTEGDAIVEGELQGQVTLTTSADIIVSRDLTYQCADGSGGATTTDPSSVAACNSSSTSNDVLGLLANEDFLIAHPPGLDGNYDTHCTDDGTEANPGISNVVPWSCQIANPSGGSLPGGVVVDAAVVTLNGSTYVPNFTRAPASGGCTRTARTSTTTPGSTVFQAAPGTTSCCPTTSGSRT